MFSFFIVNQTDIEVYTPVAQLLHSVGTELFGFLIFWSFGWLSSGTLTFEKITILLVEILMNFNFLLYNVSAASFGNQNFLYIWICTIHVIKRYLHQNAFLRIVELRVNRSKLSYYIYQKCQTNIEKPIVPTRIFTCTFLIYSLISLKV